MFEYSISGVCAKKVAFNLEGDKISNLNFLGGCPGTLQGISKLVDNMPIDDIIEKLSGITCGLKSTSCPDQLSKVLLELKNK